MVSTREQRSRIERQIENILAAQAMMAEIPDGHIAPNLGSWARMGGGRSYVDTPSEEQLCELHCGSAACFGGWVAVTPHFKKQGVRRDEEDGSPFMKVQNENDTVDHLHGSEVAKALFGEEYMFNAQMSTEGPRSTPERLIIERRLQVALSRRLAELEVLEVVGFLPGERE